MDLMANGVDLSDLGIGWKVTCNVLSMKIPDSQEKRKECSVVSLLSLSPHFWLSGGMPDLCMKGRGFKTRQTPNKDFAKLQKEGGGVPHSRVIDI